MAVYEDQSAPYASVKGVLDIIRRLRERGLPEPLTSRELARMGVSEQNAWRTVQTLQFLGLLDSEGRRTDPCELIGRATTDEYPEILGQVIKAAYAPIFSIVDPSTANGIQLTDAFRCYKPDAQRPRMVALFLGLCHEAGLVPQEVDGRRTRTPNATRHKVVRPTSVRTPRVTVPEERNGSAPYRTGNTKTVTLQGGGSVTLSVSVDLFTLNQADRDFVLRLIDALNQHEVGSRDAASPNQEEVVIGA